ncbi:interleukin-1 receptor-associated kinase 1-like [Sinocyclocheilus grahami]|uniref:interleukin-1 receptor-associated kinase 1-like n=1 Tax=Sinocyclocheilus grahami TaxID=75366 RepID=UPI0007ACEDD9|nr:PREDICTED: interleukin-1 receptor-associated kinase 1-like [Sinocyclocheilus grahami]
MSGAEFLYTIPASVMSDFTRFMDSLSHLDWILFASQVISDQTELRLLEQSPRRTDDLMHKWGCRNGTVGELLKILEGLQWFRARDIILKCRHIPQFRSEQPSTVPPVPACQSSTVTFVKESHPVPEVRPLPKPSPPPPDLDSMNSRISNIESLNPLTHLCLCENRVDPPPFSSTAMNWPFEEVQRCTCNFSPCNQIGEGGFGHVYKAVMRNTEFAVKKLKEDSHLDWNVVKESFRTEVEKLSRLIGFTQTFTFEPPEPESNSEDRLPENLPRRHALWLQCIIESYYNVRGGAMIGDSGASSTVIGTNQSCSLCYSSNILLGNHLEPKLGDFGLARLCLNPNKTPGKTSTVAKTATVRGTLAYLPEEYLKDGQLGVEIDVYSFGVVMLEVLTGRQALEIDGQSRTVYLKDLVKEEEDDGRSFSKVKHSRELSYAHAAENICRKHLDPRLKTKDTSTPHGSMEISQLACQCLDRRRKKRPRMTEVFKALQDVHSGLKTFGRSTTVRMSPVSSHPSTPEPLRSDSSSLDSLAHQFSKLHPQESTYPCLHKTVYPTLTSVVTQSSCSESELNAESWASQSSGVPCESDESQGFSQFLTSHCSRAQATSCGACGIQSSKTNGSLVESPSQSSPNEDFSDQKVFINPMRQQLVQRIELYEEGRILTSDLLSSGISLYRGMNAETREPEESDEFACETSGINMQSPAAV